MIGVDTSFYVLLFNGRNVLRLCDEQLTHNEITKIELDNSLRFRYDFARLPIKDMPR